MAGNRYCYYTNDSFAEDDRHMGMVYWVVKVTENEPGYVRAMPCNSQEKADVLAMTRNTILGISQDDVLDIVASSMRCKRIS